MGRLGFLASESLALFRFLLSGRARPLAPRRLACIHSGPAPPRAYVLIGLLRVLEGHMQGRALLLS